METCETCKFWRPDDWDGEPGDAGRCCCENSEAHGMVLWHDESCDEWERTEALAADQETK